VDIVHDKIRVNFDLSFNKAALTEDKKEMFLTSSVLDVK
jgi:hypothetical protein